VVFSLARDIFSVSQKDVVGQTVSKFRRGRFSGYLAGIAELITVAVGFYFNQASQATGSVDQYLIPNTDNHFAMGCGIVVGDRGAVVFSFIRNARRDRRRKKRDCEFRTNKNR